MAWADSYQTATPALGLTSVSDDVAIVRSTLDSIPGDKILVGHSYGGFVITNVGAEIGRSFAAASFWDCLTDAR